MSIVPTYPSGYAGAKVPLAVIRSRWDVRMLAPEFRRRIFAMMRAARRAGVELGVGGAGRTSEQQRKLFESRYTPTGTVTADVWFEGQWWRRKPGMAPAAPPGRSYHEETDPRGKALACDMVGDLVWMNDNAWRFGLAHFRDVNGEPWHVQPIEIPTSRSGYSSTVHYPLRRKAFT